ncbi:Ccl [Klebsiella pneumoniae]|uniref:Ccl n=1 Tax=Klebsiella pneumoniae TaxID=573 RepID=A0A377X7D6_KLEPN|nr:Ccl [Klebsiella pneumoniae]
MESRKQKEKKAKDAENKLNEEKKKPRKGVKDYGHDYHPAPKTEEIKGLGELKKTPKKHLNKVVVVDVIAGLVIKAVRFMNGTPSTVSLKGIVPVMANTSGHLTQKRVSKLKVRIRKGETLKNIFKR